MSEIRARDFSRRSFLKGTAAGAVAASLGTATSFAWMAPAAAAEPAPMPPHGAELRGMDLVTKSPTTEGRFGFMFKSQPSHLASIDTEAADKLLDRLGATMVEQPDVGGTSTLNNENDTWNENPNPNLRSGFTFVGQFVDHDITFDTTLLDEQESDPDATTNFRTPRYDLDAIYGRGPNDAVDKKFYNPADRDKFLLVPTTYSTIKRFGTDITDTLKTEQTLYDVPRLAPDPDSGEAKAIIADPRNDQTLIILQLHVAMQRFHNKLVDTLRASGTPRSAVFEAARRLARWHYQWMVTHEFIPAIVGQTISDSVYLETSKAPKITLNYYKPTNPAGRSFIPVEFAVAAYRFGHSMTRPRYTVQDYVTDKVVVDPVTGESKNVTVAVSSVPLFEATPTDNNLNGHRPLPPRLRIQWSKFFNVDNTKPTARPVRQFDASLAGPLQKLPGTALPDSNELGLLSQRNLRRGRKMRLPSGQQVARLMGVTPLTNAQLGQNYRIKVNVPIPTTGTGANVVVVDSEGVVPNDSLKAELAKPEWGGEAPLWFYILKEAEIVGKGRTLGPVGGRIVAEVLVGLLQKDPNSYLTLNPAWKPAPPVTPVRGRFTMADLLKFAEVWS
jgi:Animal haem peroxidase/TAT (twin-arginine translocation) pathway signal sequence